MNGRFARILQGHARLCRSLVLLSLLACTVNGFIAQTHVHADRFASAVAATLAADQSAVTPASSQRSDPGKPDSRENPASCPLCQIVHNGGAAPVLALLVFLPQQQTAILAALSEQAPPVAIAAVSYSWQGRGPPLS